MPNRVVHFEIEAKDASRAEKFYEDAFGWKMQRMGQDFGGYTVVQTGSPMPDLNDFGINGGIYVNDKKEINAFSCVIAVDDVEKAMADVKKAGGKLLDEKPMDIPTIGLYVKCEDTEGNRFTLLQPSADMTQNK